MGINVALDGPSGAGKSTIAKAVAKKLEYVYVDTGAMYRSIAYYVISKGADLSDPEQIKPFLGEISIKLCYTEAGQRVMLNDEDVFFCDILLKFKQKFSYLRYSRHL